MRPPRFPLSEWCGCADGRHLNRYLAQGDTDAEREIVDAFYQASSFPCPEEIAEANRRFLGPDPASAENWEWVRATADRELDHL